MQPLFNGDYVAAAKAYNDYYASQTGDMQSATISVVKCSALADVATQAKLIFDANRDKIQALNLSKIQPYFRYDKHWFYDINDFMVNLVGESAASAIYGSAQECRCCKIYNRENDRFNYTFFLNFPVSALISTIRQTVNLMLFYQNYAWEKAVNMTADFKKRRLKRRLFSGNKHNYFLKYLL